MKTVLFPLLFLLVIFYSCKTAPDTEPVIDEPEETVTVIEDTEPENTDELVTTGEIVVTKEVYDRTFEEIEKLISELNEIIRQREFETWKQHLTEDYIEMMSDPLVLRRISSQPIMQKNNIRLDSLNDYFRYVVVPSRSSSRVDEILFLDNTKLKAITMINGQRSILYYLVKVDDEWKIDIQK